MDAAAEVVAERGPSGVSMSLIAERTGVARATLYKYFVDAGALLASWHEREISRHVAELRQLAEADGDPMTRLTRVLSAYGSICQRRQHGSSSGALHADGAIVSAEVELVVFLGTLLRAAAASGAIRGDIPARELALYCVRALSATAGMTRNGVARVVTVTIDGLRSPH